MTSEWYARLGGETLGPLNDRQLKQLAIQGKVTREVLVSRSGNGPWVPAGKVKGLFSEGQPTPEASTVAISASSHSQDSETFEGKPSLPTTGRPTTDELAKLKKNTGCGWIFLTFILFAPAIGSCGLAITGSTTKKDHFVVTTTDFVREGNRIKLDEVEQRHRHVTVDKKRSLTSSQRFRYGLVGMCLMPIWVFCAYKAYKALRLHVAAAKQQGSWPAKT
jgi:hypothetical protein